MSEPYVEKQPPVPPFVKFVCARVPMTFNNSLSYYEALSALWKFLNESIEVINHNAQTTQDYIVKVNELEEYVNTYFSSLDVQEEINNKLDQMAEDGDLTPLIKSALNPDVAWVFDTVADMQASENLEENCYARTLGFHEIGDGGGATYKILSTGTANGMDIISVGSLKAHLVLPDEITPQLFGAYGDGTTNDTDVLRYALKYCIDNERVLYIHKPYYINESLLSNADYTNVCLNIKGDYTNNSYTTNGYGGIKFANGIAVFDALTSITGVIDGVVFTPVSRSQSGALFNNTQLTGFTFKNCYVANILAFLHNTGCNQTTNIDSCDFYTVYYFAKCDSVTAYKEFTDSTIQNCYINGGAEMNNNNCFEFASWNGSSVHDNFIDYYRTIYSPYSPSSIASQLPASCNNQYQVFRYFYWRGTNISSITFTSVGDIFNWNDPTKLTKLNGYEKFTYVGHDTLTHDIPPYIGFIDPTCLVTITDAYLQNNLANIIFVKRALTEYNYGKFKMTCNGIASFSKYNYPVTHADSIYNAGTYKSNLVDIPFAKSEDSMPSVPSLGWSNYYLGQRIKVSNAFYRLIYSYTDSAAQWIEDHNF